MTHFENIVESDSLNEACSLQVVQHKQLLGVLVLASLEIPHEVRLLLLSEWQLQQLVHSLSYREREREG